MAMQYGVSTKTTTESTLLLAGTPVSGIQWLDKMAQIVLLHIVSAGARTGPRTLETLTGISTYRYTIATPIK